MHCSGAEDLAIPDFDGTLAPVVADPTEKRLDASKWHVLASLSRTSDSWSRLLADAPSTIFACVSVYRTSSMRAIAICSKLGMIAFEQPSYSRRFGLMIL
jgi:hypothetical protein